MRQLMLVLCFMLAVFGKLPASSFQIDKPRVLHLTFHRGCQLEFAQVANELGIAVETWFIPELPAYTFDGVSHGNALYNIGAERAKRIWDLHQEDFKQFDAVITSDTPPLARIFLQHAWSKPLIIWICNRFDYADASSLDCDFPDSDYYQLFAAAQEQQNVTTIAYTAFEHYYAQSKGIPTGNLVITPCAPALLAAQSSISLIPLDIAKESTFFLPPYHNERFFIDLQKHCTALGIPSYCGRYQGALDLVDFKAIIHLPYSWSNLALFENMSHGIPYFIPSAAFLQALAEQGGYFHPNLHLLLKEQLFYLSEWYNADNSAIMTYFDSWQDLSYKIQSVDYAALRTKIKAHAQQQRQTMLARWRSVFADLFETQNKKC